MRKLNYFLSNVYVAVLLGIAAITLILKELQFVFGNAPPLLVFLVVVVFASWFGGLRAGLYATILSAAASAVLVEPYNSIYIASTRELFRILLLMAVSTISSLMIARLYKKEKQALNTVIEREKQLRQEIDKRIRTREEWNLYFTLANSSAEFIGMCDPQGMPFFINEAGLQLVGLNSLDQGLKTPVREFFFPEDQAFIMDKFFPEVAKKGQGEIEIRFRHFKTGEALWMIYNIFALKDLNGNIVGFGTVSPNITLRKQAEEALRQALAKAEEGDQMLAALMEHVPIGITIADAPDVKIRMVSRAGQELTGKPREKLAVSYGKHAEQWAVYRADGITPAVDDELPLPRATRKGESVYDEVWILAHSDGRHIPVLCNAGPIRDTAGHITGGIATWSDITARKQAEEELLRLNTELEQRVQQRTSDLKDSLQQKEVLLKEIHHRVKNNLQIIASLLQLQADSQTDAHVRDLFLDSRRRIRSMALIHEQLYKSQDLKHIDFSDYMTQLVSHIRRSFAPTLADVTVRLEIPPITLDIDHALPLGLIVNELVSNSFKHAFPRERRGKRNELWATVAQAPDGLTLEVGDSGRGLPADMDLEQSPSLGLQLVQSLVVQLQGRLTVQRRPGAIFRILIPVEKFTGLK
jgi:PAS domain S-box-containing protein